VRLLLPIALMLAVPAAAAEPEWRSARSFDVLLMPYDYDPATIRLAAGEPVRLNFINQGQTRFSFSAEDFFRAAQVRSGDAQYVIDGRVELAPGERRTIALVPAAGRYGARSHNVYHRVMGMRAEIIVE
jgi:plastocyanin